MKTTPTSACEIECNIEPLDIRRDAAIVTTYERYQRLEHHPNKALIQTWRKKTRIKQQSYLTRATTLLPEYNLPCSREKIATVAPQPLYRTAYQPTLCPHLIVKSASKAYPVHILKSLAAETIDTYPNTMTHVYTDGSALNAVEQAGYGLTIQYPDATRKDISEACGQHCNNYDAELKAIRSALQTISEDCDNPNPPCVNNIVIFTDSQSAIQAFAQIQHHKQPIVTDILTTANKLHNQNDVETSIQWIPGHCDIPGNDRADKLARQGTSKTQHDEQVSYATSKQIVQTKSRKIWHDRWARGNTGRIYYQHQQTPNQTDPINQLHRAHQTAVFRLRTHHAPLNAHLHRIKKEHPAKSVYCPDSDETIEHFLFHCPLYDNIRSRLLPAQPNIHNTLYGSTTQLQRTATYNMSAMNRRDEIVRSLGDQER